MTHFEINVQNLLYKSFEIYHFIMYYLFDLNSVVIISTERRVYIQYCGVYIQYCNAFPILPKPVIFNTNQEIYICKYIFNKSKLHEREEIYYCLI